MKVLGLALLTIVGLSYNVYAAENLNCLKITNAETAQATVAKAISGGFQGTKQEVAEKLAQRCFGQAELLGNLSGEFKYGKGDEALSTDMADRIFPTVRAAQMLREISE